MRCARPAKLNSARRFPAAMIKIAPSILSADYANLERSIHLAEEGGADMFHIDVMDGHFVPNITVGPVIVSAMRRLTKLPLDVHLMIEHPGRFVKAFSNAGADDITVHVELKRSAWEAVNLIRKERKRPGIVLNPGSSFRRAIPFLPYVDMLLIMSVLPGFAGQKFMPKVLPKIKTARKYIDRKELNVELEVDGGIDPKTAPAVARAGADILVAGSAIFGGKVTTRIRGIRKAAEGQGI